MTQYSVKYGPEDSCTKNVSDVQAIQRMLIKEYGILLDIMKDLGV